MSPPRILMCPPDYYGIEYEINPWMRMDRGSSPSRAMQQWNGLVETLEQLGVQIEFMTPQPGLPDLVFTANAGLIFGPDFYSSRFRHEVRARETPYFDAWFSDHDFAVHHLPAEMYFEGAGDALFCGNTLFAGYRIRSDVHGHQYLGEKLGVQVLPVELVDTRFYHLDTCFCPLAEGRAIYYPGAFDEYGRKVIQSHIPELLAANDNEAERFGCNAVLVGKHVILNSGCEQLAKGLKDWGYEPIALEFDEFIKSGGSAKCLTLRLDGEEAAAWRHDEPAMQLSDAKGKPTKMNKIQHVVLVRFKDGTPQETIDMSFDELRRLRDLIPGLESFSGGPYSSPEGLNKGFTHAFVMTFADAASRNNYLPHPEHERVKELVLPHVEDVIAFDYEMAAA